jgi:3-hydroxyisobutyrate dehydrogenase
MAERKEAQEPVAVLGIGAMGHGMAASALHAGLPTIVWDRNRNRSRDLEPLGARVAESAADAAANAGIVVTMVPDAEAVLSVATEQGMLDALARDAVWAQMSTIGVAGTDRVAALVDGGRPDVTLLDAPVSGSKEPAERGELTIFASGPASARLRVEPLFDALGRRTLWLGPVGAGSRMKVVNNTLLAFKAEGLAAAFAVGRGVGLDESLMIEALTDGPLLSTWDMAKLERLKNDDFSAQFALALALKDVRLALETVDAGRFEAFTSLAHEWQRAVDVGLGDDDLTVVARVLEGQVSVQ